MTQIANLVPHAMANIPSIPNIDYTCAKYFEEEISKIHHFSQPHNTEFIEKVSKIRDIYFSKLTNLLYLLI